MFEIELFTCIKMDMALDNLKWLIYHKTKPNQTRFPYGRKPVNIFTYAYVDITISRWYIATKVYVKVY